MQLQPTDALLVIDVQNDFMPGGALAVADGDAIVPLINTLAKKFDHVILTQDWHPTQHISFATTHTESRNASPSKPSKSPTAPKPSGPNTSSSTPKAQPSTPPSTSPTPNSSSAKASAATSTATPPSSKTTTSPPPASPATSASATSPPLPLRPRLRLLRPLLRHRRQSPRLRNHRHRRRHPPRQPSQQRRRNQRSLRRRKIPRIQSTDIQK